MQKIQLTFNTIQVKKGKVLPYSLLAIGPRADPGVEESAMI